MYNVTTPAGSIKVETLTEAMEYRKLYGYPYNRIVTPEENIENDIETDAMGNCYSDADPGL
jgi:hypothetical protein